MSFKPLAFSQMHMFSSKKWQVSQFEPLQKPWFVVMVVPLNVYVNGLALLYVPNLSPNSYSPTENDGFPSWVAIGSMVCTWTSCWGDGERDVYHPTRFLFGFI